LPITAVNLFAPHFNIKAKQEEKTYKQPAIKNDGGNNVAVKKRQFIIYTGSYAGCQPQQSEKKGKNDFPEILFYFGVHAAFHSFMIEG
jgi:hypothetical protein